MDLTELTNQVKEQASIVLPGFLRKKGLTSDQIKEEISATRDEIDAMVKNELDKYVHDITEDIIVYLIDSISSRYKEE